MEIPVTVVDRRHHAADRESASDPEGRSPYPSFVEELRTRAEQAERKAGEAMARAEAEIDAVRERLQRDVERRVDEGRARLLGAVIEVVDNLERATSNADPASPIAEGISLIRKQILDILDREGVEPIDTIDLEFDPRVAEAVSVVEVGPERHDRVIEEIQRGYRLGETILRPAKVKVGRSRGGDVPAPDGSPPPHEASPD